MKIVIGVTYAYPYIGSGIGNVAMKQAEELAKKGHKVTLISSNFPKTKKEFKRKKVKYLKGHLLLKLEKIGLPIPLFFLNKKMKKAIQEADIMHIHGALYPSSYQIARYTKKNKKKTVLTQHIGLIKYHGLIYRNICRLVYATMAKTIFSSAKKIIVLNSRVKKDLKKLNVDSEKISLLTNAVDTNLFKPASEKRKLELRKKYNLPSNKPIIIFVGRLVGVKAFERLFNARDKDYLILFVGEGNVPIDMKDTPHTKFIKAVPQKKLAELYQLSDIFCLPSKSEGFPLTVLESLSCGLPAIANNLEVYDEYFKNDLLIKIEANPENIKNSIKYLLKNKKKNNVKKRRDFVIKNFSWNHNVKNLLKVYEEVLKRH